MASIKEIYDALRIPSDTLATFRNEWQALSDKDKEDLKNWVDQDLAAKNKS